MKVVVGIPAYNEEKTIAKVVIQAKKHSDSVMVCDDGSTDATGEIAKELGAMVITHDRNMGKGEALRSLFVEARKIGADALVTLDADGQHDPNEIPAVGPSPSRGGRPRHRNEAHCWRRPGSSGQKARESGPESDDRW